MWKTETVGEFVAALCLYLLRLVCDTAALRCFVPGTPISTNAPDTKVFAGCLFRPIRGFYHLGDLPTVSPWATFGRGSAA